MKPSDLIKSTGLRHRAIHLDLVAAMNRYEFTKNHRELENLTNEQLGMLLIESNQPPGSEIWTNIEQHLGITLTAEQG